jgi:hypothetical protein
MPIKPRAVKQNKLLLWLLIAVQFSCGSPSAGEGDQTTATVATTTKKTQALLLTQDFPFDSADKDKVTGDYVAQTKITVPSNLATQSKWIMFEGPVLENDLVAYRYYTDSRHRFDIYGKTVHDLVMDTVSWQYHDIMNWGSDVLKVGNSLGLGSPAIWYQDSLYTLSECAEKTIEVIENGDDRSAIRTTFTGLKIGEETFDLVQDWSLAAGEPWSEIHLSVSNGALPEEMYFATGFVKHLPELTIGSTADFAYLMNWGEQSFHHENMGMAILAEKVYQPVSIDDELSHVYIFEKAPQEVRYRFLSVWERDNNGVKDAQGFRQLVEQSTKSAK